MKRSSIRSAVLLSLPCVFVLAAGLGITRWRDSQRQARIAFYTQPFTPRLQLERGKVPGYASPGLFEVQARLVSSGASGQYQWLLRGQLIQAGAKSPREIWNSQKSANPELLSAIMRGSNSLSTGAAASGAPRPSGEAAFFWRFSRLHKNADNLKFVVEAVAVPLPVADNKFGAHSISIREATPAQIAVAKGQAGARYLRQSIEMNARDDDKHFYPRNAPKP